MAMISVLQPRSDLRWFHALDPERKMDGPWHLGPVPRRKGWPAGQAVCGYDQPDKAVGRHETATEVTTHFENICPRCLAIYRSMLAARLIN